MEFKEILSKISFAPRPIKKTDEEAIIIEENQIREVLSKLINKSTNFFPLGFEQKDDEEIEEIEYADSADDYIEEQQPM